MLELSGLAVVVALMCAVMITRSITRPLALTVALAREIADGKLDSPMPEAGRDEVGRLITALGEMRNSLAQREARIVDLAFRDPLTGLANRTLFNDRLDQAVRHRDRARRHAMSVLLIDLDRFKHVNDVLGHPVGDELLNAGRRPPARASCAAPPTPSRASAATSSPCCCRRRAARARALLARQLLTRARHAGRRSRARRWTSAARIGIATLPRATAATRPS